MDKKKKLLAVLLLIWAVLIIYRVITHEEPRRVPLKYVKGQSVSSTQVGLKRNPEYVVRVDLLEERPPVTLGNPKNIFAPVRAFLPPPPPPPRPPEPPPPPPLPTPEELAIEQARRDLGQFRYLGYLNKGLGGAHAFLARGEDLFIVGKGQSVSGSIVIKDLNSSYVTLQETTTQIEMRLTISGG